MAEHTLQIGTAEVAYDLDENDVVLGVMVVIQTAEAGRPGFTRSEIAVPETQDFIKTLGLSRYASVVADSRVNESGDE